jgi:PAS domain S-box/diguanylate cyclase (GGDEF) domain
MIINNSNIVEFINTHRNILDLILDLVPNPIFVKNKNGLYIDCNDAFTKFLSFRREDIIGKSVYDLWNKKEADVFFAQDHELFKRGGLQVYKAEITSGDGAKHIVQFHKQVFLDSNGTVAGFLGVIFDITEKKNLERTLARLATIDELTGLPNRRDGMLKLEAMSNESKRKKKPYCMAMLDLDYFKQVNDVYGHTNGDIVLKEFSKLVQGVLRRMDVCFRYGGEEFIVLLPRTSQNEGFMLLERLRSAWNDKEIVLSEEVSIHSSVSIGLIQCDFAAKRTGVGRGLSVHREGTIWRKAYGNLSNR